MKTFWPQRVSAALWAILLVAAFSAERLKGDSSGGESTIYDPNPKHLWNRLNETLFIRTGPDRVKYGYDELDPLIWQNSRYLLQGDSHTRAIAMLDEFLVGHGERLVRGPLKRAWLQRDLWFLFDWAAAQSSDPNISALTGPRRELVRRVAEVIRRLELTPEEIEALPDNCEGSSTNALLNEFAGGLFKKEGGWVCLGLQGGEPVAPIHARSFGGRSVFLVMVHFPGGATAANDYLKRLEVFAPKWINVTNMERHVDGTTLGPLVTHLESILNTNLPQFPTNTQWALVRRMCVIDSSGQIRATHVTEGIQARQYVAIRNDNPYDNKHPRPQRMAEFKMDRRAEGVLRDVGREERDFLPRNFFSQGFDPFETNGKPATAAEFPRFRVKVLTDCYTCHNGPGIASVMTYTGAFNNLTRTSGSDLNTSGNPEREASVTSEWKGRQFDWGLLKGLWLQSK